ncbi:hypothetical protein [Comamonas composti]|uniref:hypothetical protein n=1 Tax=Comamonas composti TaxID=408558 RepID=UPI00041CEC50|nr:hypothetical protein [Comamonas composti]
MVREILSGASASTPTPASNPPAALAPVAAPAAQTGPQDRRDMLAGALPPWDLLPASPFVRRVR